LRATLVKDKSLFEKFDILFRQFWSLNQPILQPRDDKFSQLRLREREDDTRSFEWNDQRNEEEEENERKSLKRFTLYSSFDKKSYQRFVEAIEQDKLNLMKRLVRKFNRCLATIPGRRRTSAYRGEIDFRKSLRKAVSKGGSVILLEKREKKISRAKLVILADISGSMQSKSDFLFLLLYLFKNVTRNAEIFVFSTKLMHLKIITSFSNIREASRSISSKISIWGSGTRIGECLNIFLSRYQALIDKRTTVVIISDGWDLGEPDLLRRSMLELRQKSARIVWLNPLVKTAGYEPICIGMKTAIEFVDVFAPTDIFLSKGLFEAYFGKLMVLSS
jgi:uncharacterized protein with von Willebrand factor type A (vWA) domain